ncbi:MAG: hypothetical protein COT81_04495 [Candidatus Buchananbacteria bacterium CG10_big_fil_rev_8_21_14_0_10_42_9]|uniref:Bis(5'-nucleosyl)-tetraphosphatase [asymmetrical] n=1 Tax=Candidatus Buchananbacteria bacterium CG10_big_fil_rev_8_21_14_0_10_42_9 TaxID=1974526 RepID=A0A2H0W0B3_9BACT|nr:MAG: hypothetical protein COT81_04495 [Candidatus Buchananbacteria bacterium CG10_big_fil_rev_8_21_14_0_10_42_9]
MKIKKQTAVGFVVYLPTEPEIKYLLLRHGEQWLRVLDRAGITEYWNFPKGRIDVKDADNLSTAYRELEEETGLTKNDVELDKDFEYRYDYSFKVQEDEGIFKVNKTAIFHIAKAKSDHITISPEHQDYGWFTYDEASKKINRPQIQQLLDKARDHILKKQ